ncbi:carboxymuconolactone decarboxylase family protein [Micromonospora sp. WMMD1120]|uniref:carboxymuconolactone decarboxylase family protein n=1 Tax=Micromonospora sp. WMMD1120 TaxID=3016106 RepID=UPI002416E410|nr:carboxymuconolactone decarboxylase family protein [Micromonospora sp. WMMD1120]MDG4810069.1 carboxymuconolactone decarboxylase family protein [Micromonospora sp. WMMD1120]
MARLPYVNADEASEPVAEALRAMPAKVGIVQLIAHAETCLRPFLRLGQAILTAQQLDPALRELAILRTAQLSGAEYEAVQHERIALQVGVTAEQVEAVRAGRIDGPEFTELQRSVLALTTEVVAGDVDDDTFDAVSLPPRETMELILAIGFYLMLGRVMNAVQVDLEPAAEVEVAQLRR